MRPTRSSVAVLFVVASASIALVGGDPAGAHPGSTAGGAGEGLLHPLLGLDHLLVMVAIGALAVIARRSLRVGVLPVAFVSGMTAGTLAAMCGLALPGAEWVIAASVLAAGALLIVGPDSMLHWLPGAVAAVGLVHGHAHGTEAPLASRPLLYLGGVVATTVALHAAGAAVGWTLGRSPTARGVAGVAIAGAGVALLTAS